MKDDGCTKLYILNDKEVYGKGIADGVAEGAKEAGHPGRSATRASTPRPPTTARWRRRSSPPARTACSSAASRRTRRVQVWKDVARRQPEHQAVRPGRRRRDRRSRSKLERRRCRRYLHHGPDARSEALPAAGQKFFTDYKAKYGKDPEPYAIYGYEAMSVVLDAIKRAGDKGNDRQAVDRRSSSRRRTAIRCSARTRSTRTVTRRSPTTARDTVKNGKLDVRQGHQGPDGS